MTMVAIRKVFAPLTLTISVTACSVGAGSHARLTRLSGALAGSPSASPASTLPKSEDLYLGLTPVNLAMYGQQLSSLRAVAESVAARFEIHSIQPADVGRTFVWDVAGGTYTSSTRSDAPAGAIRVLLYRIDQNTDWPRSPLTEIGTIDLYPRNQVIGGSAEAPRMRYVVSGVSPDRTIYADFTAVEGGPRCACARLAGWVSNGVTRVDFSGSYAVQEEGVRFTTTARVNTRPGEFRLDATLEESLIHSDARFAFQGDSVEARGVLIWDDAGTPDEAFTVFVNGQAFADANRSDTEVIGPQGRALTSIEQLATRQLYRLTYGLLLNLELPTYLTFNCGCGQ
jgi:hypothetical protein